jgi:hypothetical protein
VAGGCRRRSARHSRSPDNLVAGIVSAFLSGCASVGNEQIADASPQSVSAQIVKGKTTQVEVRQLYGDPMKSSFTDSGNEIWEYEFSRLHSNAYELYSLCESGL